MSDERKVKMTIKIESVEEYEETNTRGDGSTYITAREKRTIVYEQTVDNLNIADIVSVVNKLSAPEKVQN